MVFIYETPHYITDMKLLTFTDFEELLFTIYTEGISINSFVIRFYS